MRMSIIALPRNVTHKRQLAKTQQCHAYNLRYIAILGEHRIDYGGRGAVRLLTVHTGSGEALARMGGRPSKLRRKKHLSNATRDN
eukprot:scaffold4381_cov45-Phaeocystis_antarctica.AAC.3